MIDWPNHGPYLDKIQTVAELWQEVEAAIWIDYAGMSDEQLKVCRHAAYNMVSAICAELIQFGHDPKAVLRAVIPWHLEAHQDFAAFAKKADLTWPIDKKRLFEKPPNN